MKDKKILTIVVIAGVLAVMGGAYAQDKYTAKVPAGLAFSEFSGSEAWQTISMSRGEKVVSGWRSGCRGRALLPREEPT